MKILRQEKVVNQVANERMPGFGAARKKAWDVKTAAQLWDISEKLKGVLIFKNEKKN